MSSNSRTIDLRGFNWQAFARKVRSDLYDQMQLPFPVIFEKRIVALKLLQCSLRKTNTEGGFVRGGPKSNSISACWLGGRIRFHVV